MKPYQIYAFEVHNNFEMSRSPSVKQYNQLYCSDVPSLHVGL